MITLFRWIILQQKKIKWELALWQFIDKQAKELLKNWLLFNNYLEDTDEFDDDLVGSIEIWEQELNELSDPKRISVDLNELMNK